mmetsp:Transcript_3965/g.9511  ORF Transcript_3965/g.9511 Transcript_3965/m.9511 type:complete len:140 (-) Transcript_3965:144-563(-)
MTDPKETVRREVLEASQAQIKSFNDGDAATLAETYLPDGTLNDHSSLSAEHSSVVGREKITQFWDGLIRQSSLSSPRGSPRAEVKDVKVMPLDEASCKLERSASLGSGDVVSKETWVKGKDGEWKVAEDNVTVVQSFAD